MLAMSSTGTILAAVEPQAKEKVKAAIETEWAFSMFYRRIHGKQRTNSD